MPDDTGKTTDARVRSAKLRAPADGAGLPKSTEAPKPEAVKGADASGAAAKGTPEPSGDAVTKAATATATKPPPGAAGRTEPTLPTPSKPTASEGTDYATATPVEGTLIGSLDADERIRASGQQGERTLWTSAIVITLLYTSLIAGHVLMAPLSQEAAERERIRRGQDAPGSISVELVPDPDKTAKTTRWQEGAQAQTPNPEQPPTPEQMASLEQPEVPELQQEEQEAKEAKEAQEEEPKETDKQADNNERMMLDIESLVDAAAADFKRNLDHALAKRPQRKRREQQAALSGGGMKVRGTGASGKSDVFSRSVIAALMKTRPGPFALWGRVLVSFEISPSGRLNYVRVLRSSGNSALDKAAVDAIHKARFQTPPPGLTSDERTYIIDYIFG